MLNTKMHERCAALHVAGQEIAAPTQMPPASIWSPHRSAISATSACARSNVLAAADVIACEDTRVTRKLTEHYGIATPLTPYHEHNAAEARPKILARLVRGRSRGAGVGRRHAADLRPRLQAGARSARRRPRRHRAPGCLGGADGAFRRRSCRPTGSSSRASCRRRKRRGKSASPSSRAFRQR